MNQRLEKYLLSRRRELRAVDTKDSALLQSVIHGSLSEIDLIFANFGHTKKYNAEHYGIDYSKED